MAQSGGGGIGFVMGKEFLVGKKGTDCAGYLFLAGAAMADHSLLDAEGRILEHRQVAEPGHRDGGTTSRTEGLSRLEVLDVDSLLDGDVPDRGAFDGVEDGAANFRKAVGLRELTMYLDGVAMEEFGLLARDKLQQGDACAPKAWVNAKDNAPEGTSLEIGYGETGWFPSAFPG